MTTDTIIHRLHENGRIRPTAPAYFEKVGEGTNQDKVNRFLGSPTMTLDSWLEWRKAPSV